MAFIQKLFKQGKKQMKIANIWIGLGSVPIVFMYVAYGNENYSNKSWFLKCDIILFLVI